VNPVTRDMVEQKLSGLGTFAGTTTWGIYIGREPDSPDGVITLYDTGGPAEDASTNGAKSTRLLHPTFQVRVRHQSYVTGYAKALAVETALNRCGSFYAGSTRYLNVFKTDEIMKLATDEQDRVIFVQNFRAVRRDLT